MHLIPEASPPERLNQRFPNVGNQFRGPFVKTFSEKISWHIRNRIEYAGHFVKIINPLIRRVDDLDAAAFAIAAERHRPAWQDCSDEIGAVVENSNAAFQEYFQHRFALLGTMADVSRPEGLCHRCRATAHALGDEYSAIEWHRDFGSGVLFGPNSRPASALNAHRRRQVEVKWPWELSRLQHLPQMGAVWRVHGDSSHRASLIREFQFQVMDWALSNPQGLGVNWACSMDIGIRGANLALANRLFSFEGAEKTAWGVFFRRLISQHLEFCGPHLKQYVGNNHAIAELASVYVMSVLLPSSTRASHWRKISHEFLLSQIARQVNRDGMHYERSVYYHLYTLEMCLYAALIARYVGDSFPREYVSLIDRMHSALRRLVGVDGTLPMIGDRDEGHFLFPLGTSCDHTRISHILSLCENFLGPRENGAGPDHLVKMMIPVHRASVPAENSTCRWSTFADSGIQVVRSSSWSVASSVGPSGLESTGHEHLDRLSVVVSHIGGPVIIDPGTSRYTSSLVVRRAFRSLLAHNGPCYIDGADSELPLRAFGHFYHPKSGSEIEPMAKGGIRVSMWAEQESRVIRREVFLSEESDVVEIHDIFGGGGGGGGGGRGRVAVCVSPDLACVALDRSTYSLRAPGRQLRIETESFVFDRLVRPCSLRYGEEADTSWLIFEGPVADGETLVWRIMQERSL
jgi:hypothetical protein